MKKASAQDRCILKPKDEKRRNKNGISTSRDNVRKNFFEHQLPALIRAINRLADVDEKRQAAEPAAVMKSNTVYVCYEENSHELAIEDGAVNELYVASSLDEVYRWVDKQQKNAEQNFYTVLNNEGRK